MACNNYFDSMPKFHVTPSQTSRPTFPMRILLAIHAGEMCTYKKSLSYGRETSDSKHLPGKKPDPVTSLVVHTPITSAHKYLFGDLLSTGIYCFSVLAH